MSFTTRGTETTCDACGAEIEPPVTWRAMSDHEKAACPAWRHVRARQKKEGK